MDKLDDIVFENKNKAYGAYLLRKRYLKSVSTGLFISLLIFGSVTIIALIRSMQDANVSIEFDLNQEILDYNQYNNLKNIDSIQLNKPVPKQQIAKNLDKSMLVVDSIIHKLDTLRNLKLPDLKSDSLKNDSLLSDTAREGSENGKGNGDLYVKVDVLPEPPCGLAGIAKFQKQYTQYPADAKKNNIQGDVQIQLFITKEGDVKKVSVKKNSNPLLDNEALRVTNLFVKTYPKWKPGKRYGKPQNFWTIIKFKFRLY